MSHRCWVYKQCKSQIIGLLGQGSDFSPASACGQLTDTDGFPELLEVEATHCKQAEIVAVVVGPMPQYPSCNNIYGGSGLHPANTVCSLYHIPAPSGCIYEPVPVFSSSLSTETRVSLPSLCAHQPRHVLGGGVQWWARTLCAALPLFCLLQACWGSLLWASKPPYLSQLISWLVKGVPRVREHFLFHSFLPGLQFLSWFLVFFLPTWLCGDLSYSVDCMRSSFRVQ